MTLNVLSKTKTHKIESAGVFAVPEPIIQLDAVIDKLTNDEYERYLDLDYYDPKATKEVKQKSVEVKRAKMKLERGGSLNASEFVETAKVFVQQGVVTQARFDEILKALT